MVQRSTLRLSLVFGARFAARFAAAAVVTLGLAGSVAGCDAAPGPPGTAAVRGALSEVRNDQLGYRIQIPSTMTTESADERGGLYREGSLVVEVRSGGELKTPSDLLRDVDAGDAKVELFTRGDMVVARLSKEGAPRVVVFSGPRGARVYARCMADRVEAELALTICASLRSSR